jgi:hypothetical protein
VAQGGIALQKEGKWNVRFDGRALATGPFVVKAACEGADAKVHGWRAEYQDVLDVACSRTGPDGIRDDQNYLDDVASPVKEFLDNPNHARPDGTLLRDHVLFIVVCYGLPKTAAATYGIARGIDDRPSNHGAAIDLGQRLQLLYYDVEGALGFAPRPHRFRTKEPFAGYFFRAPQAWPLYGKVANPFVHPLVYQKNKGPLDRLAEPPPYTPQTRDLHPGRHLYFSMRIDGATPLEARGLVDRAVYASAYAGPMMGLISGISLDKSRERVGRVAKSSVGNLLWERGFRHLYFAGAERDRLRLFHLAPETGFLNRVPVFLPGGIAATLQSEQGWNREKSKFHRYFAAGVTATLGAARVYQGAPHIHDKSWWDDQVLYPCLLRGKTLGECLLANQVHLEWISTFVGDPLYRLPEKTMKDTRPPEFDWDRDVQVLEYRGAKGQKGVWARVDLHSTVAAPEVAQMAARREGGGLQHLCQTFEGVPYTLLGSPEEAYGKVWQIELLDPYGNRTQHRGTIDRKR